MKKKIIGISCSEKLDSILPLQYVPSDYINAIHQVGGVPVLIPMTKDVIEDQLELVDAVIMTGGDDVNPVMYGEMSHPVQGPSNMQRDLQDIALIKACVEKNIPILGICRGCQIINVAFGGTLYQDNMEAGSHVGVHSQKERFMYPSHTVDIEEGSFLYKIFGSKTLVNSFHHQSVKDLGKGLKAVAIAPDGIVEAIQHESKFVWACQFHPEMMHMVNEDMLAIFKQFVEEI